MPRRSASMLLILLRSTVGRWVWWYYRVSVHDHDRPMARRGPMVLLANHVNFWDPFLLAFGVRRPIRFLAADGNFRTRGMHILMTAMGAIPKAKARTDMESLRILQREITAGEIVALFPEGQRTWDGRPRPIPPATAKLARVLGAPVVMAEIRGGYLSKPRWAHSRRRGRIEIHLRTILRGHELTHLPRSLIHQRLERALAWNDHDWQRATGVRFVGRRPAEGVEQALYWCPACGAWGTIRGEHERIHCTVCATTGHLTASGRLSGVVVSSTGELLPNVAVWGARQAVALNAALRGTREGGPGLLPYHFFAHYATGYRSRPLHSVGPVRGVLTKETLTLHPVARAPAARAVPQFLLTAIGAIHVQYTRQLEFYAEGTLHVLRVSGRRDSAARIEATVLSLHELYKVTKH
ncbi:MAG: lysophospholipid acyltransferase family protein [Alkalispirochaeta sp.]